LIRDSEPEQSEEFLEKALQLSKSTHDDEGIADCLSELAQLQLNKNEVKGSLHNFHVAATTYQQIGHLEKGIVCFRKLGLIQFGIGNYKDSLESELAALKMAKEHQEQDAAAEIHNRIGEILKILGDFIASIEHHTAALQIFESNKDLSNISISCYLIGNCFNWANELDEAYNFLNRSLTIAEDIENKKLQVKPTGSLAILYTKLREYDKAHDYFLRSIELVNVTGNNLLKADLLKNMGNLYYEQDKLDEAIQILNESVELIDKENVKEPLIHTYKLLAATYEKKGEIRESLTYYKKYISLSDEQSNKEISLKSKGLQLKYDFEGLQKEKDIAEKTVELKDKFIANLSHEIRTPLNGVLGMANLLSDTKPTPEQLEYINTIKLSANNLITIINDLLDFSKIQDGVVKIENREFDVHELLSNIVQLFKVKADEKNIELNCSFDKNLPKIIIGDASRLNQIILNIVSNAIKFTESGKIKIESKITSHQNLDAKILFTISDTGIGIDQKELESIFESFTQIKGKSDKLYSGTGLGLSIAKQLTELQNGVISVSSKPGSGSTFKIEIPFRLLEPILKEDITTTDSSFTPRDLSDINVLLVEDNKVNQFLAKKILCKMGFKVDVASSGQEALDYFSKGMSCDVILMDVQMPEMNGYELTGYIREFKNGQLSNIPIVALTAYASSNEKDKAAQAGMNEYLTKPYSPDELLSVILSVTRNAPDTNKPGTEQKINEAAIRTTSDNLIELFGGSITDVISLLQMLVVQIPQIVGEIKTSIEEKNWSFTFQSAHKLKSSLHLLKIEQLNNMIAEIEEYSKDQTETERIPQLFKSFSELSIQTVRLLKSEILRLKKIN